MKKYTFSFMGRQSGAIGISYAISDNYKADNLGEALYMLYTDYQHITGLQATENGKKISTEGVDLIKCDVSHCYPQRPTKPKTGEYYKVNR